VPAQKSLPESTRIELSVARTAKMKWWRHVTWRFQSRNGHIIRSSCNSAAPHYRAPSDHYSHLLASLVATCRAGAPCGVDLVFPKSSLKTGCVLVSHFVSMTRKSAP
jgi:hypothetical protein